MRHLVLMLLSFSLSCTIEPSDGDTTDEADALGTHAIHVIHDVAYGEPKDDVHVLDIYEPTNGPTKNRPLVLWIHGGGFAKDSRDDSHIVRLARATTSIGFVSVSIDYTLANKHLDPNNPYPYPEYAIAKAREDVRTALGFLRAHADEYGIDPKRVAVGGASAGAMTALTVAYGSTPAHRDEGIRAVVDLWGALESRTLLQPGDAPLLIMHGTDDHVWMPFEQAVRLKDSAHAEGVPCVFRPLAGKNHGPWEDLDKYLQDDILPFLRHHL